MDQRTAQGLSDPFAEMSARPLGLLARLTGAMSPARPPRDPAATNTVAVHRLADGIVSHPPGTDWAWRPDLWQAPFPPGLLPRVADRTRLDPQVTLYHDSLQGDVSVAQGRTAGNDTPAGFSLTLSVEDFAGSFVSLAIGLPPAAAANLRRRHILRASVRMECERACRVYARINVRHGPNTEQIVHEISPDVPVADFDLCLTELDERRVNDLWLDLIADRPDTNRIVFADVVLARFPRGGF